MCSLMQVNYPREETRKREGNACAVMVVAIYMCVINKMVECAIWADNTTSDCIARGKAECYFKSRCMPVTQVVVLPKLYTLMCYNLHTIILLQHRTIIFNTRLCDFIVLHCTYSGEENHKPFTY